MARILVVEDEDFFRLAVAQYLQGKGHTVTQAANGKIAQDILSSTDVDVIISDVQMPHMNGVELLEWVKSEKPTPFILMTGFTNLLETQSAYDLGADEFLAKPFKNSELVEAIKRLENKESGHPKSGGASSSIDAEFCRVSIEEFVSRNQIDFDVYVRLATEKYVKIGQKGDLIPADSIRAYREKGIAFLYIRKDDFGALVGLHLESSSPQQLAETLAQNSEQIIDAHLRARGVDTTSFEEAKEFFKTSLAVVLKHGEALELLSRLKEMSTPTYIHSLGTSLYSVMMARKMGFTSSQLFFKLALAGLFHDIGKTALPRDLIERPPDELSEKERAELESHPAKGKEILANLKVIPSDVIQMVYEHHEDCVGQGYPNHLVKNQLHPLSRVLITANVFVEHAISSGQGPDSSALEVIRLIENTYLDRLDKNSLQTLKQLFQ